MKELKFLKYATIVFMLFILFWVNFVGYILGTQGSKEEIKTVQTESAVSQEGKLKAKEEDAEILGKFWNDEGHFIVVYNGLTKVPEILEVGYSEWQYMRIGKSIRNKLNITTYISKLVGEFSKYLLS